MVLAVAAEESKKRKEKGEVKSGMMLNDLMLGLGIVTKRDGVGWAIHIRID